MNTMLSNRRTKSRHFASYLLLLLAAIAVLPAASGLSDENDRPRYASLADSLIERGGVQRGVVALLGADAELAIAMARATDLLIHVRDPRADAIEDVRRAADEAGFGIDRIIAERGSIEQLPYATNVIDVVFAAQVNLPPLANLGVTEVLRVLRPEGTGIIGKAMLHQGPDAELSTWKELAEQAGADHVTELRDSDGSWVQFSKPVPSGIDDWTHWEHGPDNNPVSADSVIKAPYMTQFMAHPMYIGMPSITTAAGGRTFLAIGHISHHRREWDLLYRLIARNGYNGTVLWERKLPEGYLVHRSAFIATKKSFYMIDNNGCLQLDSQTGEEQGRITIPGVTGEWKWMVLNDGILYVLAGKKERGTRIIRGDREVGGWSWADLSPGYYGTYPHGFGNTLAAYDLRSEKVLWIHGEDEVIDSRAMALRDGKVYLFCPEQHLRALDAATGEVLWTNSEKQVRDLIAQPGKALTSTPGFKTMCIVVATPDALIIQGQTRMNVVAVSTKTGYVLWTKRKITNNPNAIYLDGQVILGVGQRGNHVAVDPVSGAVQDQLDFTKRACTRLTASGDSLFCRGEGTLRFDRETKKVMIDGSARPGCNDGALPANGLLYIGPWQCDCNLSLIGTIARCSAGDFRFDHIATDEERLESSGIRVESVAPADADWPTLRGNNDRSSSSIVSLPDKIAPAWAYDPGRKLSPTAPISAIGMIFSAGDDGVVRAIDANRGAESWTFKTCGPIKHPPTIWNGRAYVGSGDGYVYCLDATDGTQLWKFRAAPVERHIMVYDRLCSTWPVNTGITVHDGIAYFAAGIIDHDGTYVYALDATTGSIKWQNNSSGHLSPELRKGVSAQGNLTVLGDQLLLAGGNQVSPAPFDIQTGELRAKPFAQGQPKANNGKFAGVFHGRSAIVGGRILYSADENVATKGSFVAFSDKGAFTLNFGGVPPAWDENTTAIVNFKHGSIECFDTATIVAAMDQGVDHDKPPAQRRWLNVTAAIKDDLRWASNLGEPNKFEAVSLAICPNAVVAVVRNQQKFRSQPKWRVVALDVKSGNPLFQYELQDAPLPGGLLIDRNGRIVVTMLDGRLFCAGK